MAVIIVQLQKNFNNDNSGEFVCPTPSEHTNSPELSLLSQPFLGRHL